MTDLEQAKKDIAEKHGYSSFKDLLYSPIGFIQTEKIFSEVAIIYAIRKHEQACKEQKEILLNFCYWLNSNSIQNSKDYVDIDEVNEFLKDAPLSEFKP